MRHGGSFGFCGGQSYPADAEAAGQCRAAAHVKAEAASDAGHAACHGADSGSAVGAPAAMVFHLPCSGGGTFVYLIYGAQGRSTAPAASDVLSAPPPGAAAARGPAARRDPKRTKRHSRRPGMSFYTPVRRLHNRVPRRFAGWRVFPVRCRRGQLMLRPVRLIF